MEHPTMKLFFPHEAVLKLLEEAAFEGFLTVIPLHDVTPGGDVHLAVFILEVEPVLGCGVKPSTHVHNCCESHGLQANV